MEFVDWWLRCRVIGRLLDWFAGDPKISVFVVLCSEAGQILQSLLLGKRGKCDWLTIQVHQAEQDMGAKGLTIQ